MSKVEDTLWNHLVEHHSADRAQMRAPATSRPRTRPLAIATATTGVAAVAAALIVSATTSTPPAYALTAHADGSITISLNNLTTGIPQLNSRLQQIGINYTVIPVTHNCSFTTPVLSGPGPGSLSETITIGNVNDEPAGVDGYLAAEQLPNGSIGLAIGGMKAPLPSCFSPTLMKVEPSNTSASSSAAAGPTTATVRSTAPLPIPAAVRRQLNAEKSHATSLATATIRSSPPSTSK